MIFEHLHQFAQGVGKSAGNGNWFQNLFGGGGGGKTDSTISISAGDLGLPNTPTQIGGGELVAILNLVYVVAGIVAVVVIIIGGIRYTTSNGDSNGIQSAKNTIMYAVIGLVVVIIAAAITNFVIEIVARGNTT